MPGTGDSLGGRGATLLLGVHAWPTSESLLRRRVIRSVYPQSDAVHMRFIMSNDSARRKTPGRARRKAGMAMASAGSRGGEDEKDIIYFSIRARGSQRSPRIALEKYLLANAFLRYAASSDAYDFVGRTEDDALINVSHLGTHLQRILAGTRRAGPHGAGASGASSSAQQPLVLYGVRGTWVMWDRINMLPLCWGRASSSCMHLGYDGPFLLWQGPLVVYSSALARALVSLDQFNADAARVAANWSAIISGRLSQEKLVSPNQPPRLGLVYSGVAEDVYYSALLAVHLSRTNLTVVSVPLVEYRWDIKRPNKPLRDSAVFHRLTTWAHLNASGLVERGDASSKSDLGSGDSDDPRRLEGRRVITTDLLNRWWVNRRSRSPMWNCRPLAQKFGSVFRVAVGGECARCCCTWTICDA